MTSYPPVRSANPTQSALGPPTDAAILTPEPALPPAEPSVTRGQLLRATAFGLAVNVFCCLIVIPVVHIVAIMLGPFFGGIAAGGRVRATPRQALQIGVGMGVVMGILWVIIVAVLQLFFGGTANAPYQVPNWLLWLLPRVARVWVTAPGRRGA